MTTQQFPLDGPVALDVRVSLGAVVVRAEDGADTAVVELIPRRENSDVLARTRVSMAAGTLTVRGPKGRGWGLDKVLRPEAATDIVDVHVVVPAGTSMRLCSYAAQVAVSGRAGRVSIVTGVGSSTVERIDGDLDARFADGQLEVARVDGSATVRLNGGRAHLGAVTGAVDLAGGSGDVGVDTAHGRLRARTGAGTVTIGRAGGDVDASTGSGTVSVGVGPGQPARLDIATGHGRLSCDLDVTDTEPVATNGPAITIRARSGLGDVRLFRAVA